MKIVIILAWAIIGIKTMYLINKIEIKDTSDRQLTVGILLQLALGSFFVMPMFYGGYLCRRLMDLKIRGNDKITPDSSESIERNGPFMGYTTFIKYLHK